MESQGIETLIQAVSTILFYFKKQRVIPFYCSYFKVNANT